MMFETSFFIRCLEFIGKRKLVGRVSVVAVSRGGSDDVTRCFSLLFRVLTFVEFYCQPPHWAVVVIHHLKLVKIK